MNEPDNEEFEFIRHSKHATMWQSIWTGLVIWLLFPIALSAAAPIDAWYRSAMSYDRARLNLPKDSIRVRAAGNLGGGGMVTGWFEYDLTIPTTGWYELLVEGHGGGVKFILDPDSKSAQVLSSTFRKDGPNEKAGNLWLSAGAHRLRLQRNLWIGFPPIRAILLRAADGQLHRMIAAVPASDRRLFRAGKCEPIDILHGGNLQQQELTVMLRAVADDTQQNVRTFMLPPGKNLARLRVAPPCEQPGRFSLSIGDDIGHQPRSVRNFEYEVFDTDAITTAKNTSARKVDSNPSPVIDISCASRTPDYSSDTTRVTGGGKQAYRESGDIGWTRYVRATAAARQTLKQPSWYAYVLDGLTPQQPYRIKVDYPDDASRTFAIVLREGLSLGYPPAIGAESNGANLDGSGSASVSMTVWPRTSVPRLLFLTAHDGERAACSRIRVYRESQTSAPVKADGPSTPRRQVMHWYEEGSSFLGLFGALDVTRGGMQTAVERWFDTALSHGVGTLVPTVAVYSFQLFPSNVVRSFAPDDDDDPLRRMMFEAERRDMRVVAELFPRTDDLGSGYGDGEAVPPNAAISRDGRTDFYSPEGKRVTATYNALAPETQNWYVSLVGEVADRYRDSPAFTGISLRLMRWANYGLSNLVSLDWGYDDDTLAAFQKETGISVIAEERDAKNRFEARYRWLMANARSRWIEWRCGKIAQLITRLRNRLRQARPDLVLYLNAFDDQGHRYPASFSRLAESTDFNAHLREAGIDPVRLARIDGVKLINAAYRYGRREVDALERGARDPLLDPARLGSLAAPGGAHFLSSGQYLEITDVVAPPAQLGFAEHTKATWATVHATLAGRQALESHALALAEFDALSLGDGGNGYIYGSAEVAEFMREYAQLPARPFADRSDAVDPVRVRELHDDKETTFYAVSRVPFATTIDLHLSAPARVARLSNGSWLQQGNSIEIPLRPYELFVGRVTGGARISSVKTRTPQTAQQLARRQIEWIEERAQRPPPSLLAAPGAEGSRHLLEDAALASREALNQGRYGRATSILEHSDLLGVYRRLGESPPGLRSKR